MGNKKIDPKDWADSFILAESILDIVHEPLLILNEDYVVISASSAFYRFFHTIPSETIGKVLFDLQNRDWDIPALRQLLEKILPNSTSRENIEINHVFSHLGEKMMKVHARRIPHSSEKMGLILLSLQDITEQTQAKQLEDAVDYAKTIAYTLKDSFIILDKNLRILSANLSFYHTFQIDREKIEGKLLYEIENGYWNNPKLKELLENILPENHSFMNFSMQTEGEKTGKKDLLLNARQMNRKKGEEPLIFLSIEDVTEYKQLERKLQETVFKLRIIFDQSFQFMGLLSPEGILLETNLSAIHFIGANYRDVIGKPFWEGPWWRESKKNQEVIKGAIARAARGDLVTFESSHKDTKGNIHLIESIIRPVRDEAGKIVFLVPEGRDITELRRVQEQLRDNLRKYEAIFNQAFTFMGVMTLEGILIEINSHALQFAGVKAEDVLQKPFWQTPWWTHSSNMQKKLQEAISKVAKGETVHFEATHIAKDGSLHYVDFVLRPIQNESGKVIFMVPEGRDITARRNAENRLEENFYKYNAIFNQTFTLMGILTSEGILIEANPMALESVGATLKEVIRKPFWETPWWNYSEELRQRLKEAIVKVAAGETVCFELTYKGVDRQLHYVDFVLKPIFDKTGKILFLLPTGHDITDLRQAEMKLQKTIENKTAFTSMVSHEIRTPLAALKESIAIVLDGLAGDVNAKQREFLTISQKNIDRLIRFVSEVLDFQKIEDRKLVLHRKKEDIVSMVEQVRDQMLPLCDKRGISLILDLPKCLPTIYCDKDKIIQVFQNLLNNSIKATEKGYIKISVGAGCKYITFCVEDTGIGIKKEDLSKLFLPYVQLGPKPGGTGLGLSIAHEIIAAHRGKIWAESIEGKGTSLYFILPIY